MKSIFQEAMNLRSTWLKATAKELYGVLEYRTLEVDKPSYKLVSPERKREVTRFLLEQLKKPTDLVTPQIERIYMPYELSKIISDSQSEVLNSLMDKRVFTSITNAGIVGQSSYSVARYLEEIRKGLFAELEDPRVTVDPVRRQLQAIFVGKLAALVNPPSSAQAGVTDTELRGAARMVLQILDSQVEQAEKNAREIDTRAHLYDLQKEIEAAL